jgi:hypothetical protein
LRQHAAANTRAACQVQPAQAERQAVQLLAWLLLLPLLLLFASTGLGRLCSHSKLLQLLQQACHASTILSALLAVLLLLLLTEISGSTAGCCINKRLQHLICDACRPSKPYVQLHTLCLGPSAPAPVAVAALGPWRTAAAVAASCLSGSSSCP